MPAPSDGDCIALLAALGLPYTDESEFALVKAKGLPALAVALEDADRNGVMPFGVEDAWASFEYELIAQGASQ